jgi:transposase
VVLTARQRLSFFFVYAKSSLWSWKLEAGSEAMFGGELEVDESYFRGKRIGKRGRGAAGKIPVFGLLKRGGRVYVKVQVL